MCLTTPFTFCSSLAPYNISPTAYFSAHPSLTGLVASAVVIHKNRVLLIQRAAHDGFPLKWECPGGGVDLTDASILHALCREVHEEAGLHVQHVVDVVDTLEFLGSSDQSSWRKITFLVELEATELPPVQLNAEEHVDAVWATEEDVVSGVCDGRRIEFAYEGQRQTVLDVLSRVDVGILG